MRETRKRAISVLLALLLLTSALPATAQAASTNGLTPEIAQAYLDVIQTEQANLGEMRTFSDENGELCCAGVLYAELVDFDANGIDELVIVSAIQDNDNIEYSGWGWTTSNNVPWINDALDIADSGPGPEWMADRKPWVGYCIWTWNEQTKRAVKATAYRNLAFWSSEGSESYGCHLTYITPKESTAESTYIIEEQTNLCLGCVLGMSSEGWKEYEKYCKCFKHHDNGSWRSSYIEDKRYCCLTITFELIDYAYCYKIEGLDVAEAELNSTLSKLKAIASYTTKDSQLIAAQLPYTGDISQMNMSAEQAAAFAEVLRGTSMPIVLAALFDGGNGIPALWVAMNNYEEYEDGKPCIREERFVEWNGSQAVVFKENEFWKHYACFVPEKREICCYDGSAAGGAIARLYSCKLQNGRFVSPQAYLYEGMARRAMTATEIESDWEEYFGFSVAASPITERDWVQDEVVHWALYLKNGVVCTVDDFEEAAKNLYAELDGIDGINELGIKYAWGGKSQTTGRWADGAAVAATLDAYAAAMNAEKQLASSRPHITIDYARTATFKSNDDYAAYLEELLKSTGSDGPNDADKSRLATYIENSVTALSSGTVKAKNNRLTLKAKDIEGLVNNAQIARNELLTVLTENDVGLNKGLSMTVRVDGTSIDPSRPVEIKLDKSLKSCLHGAEIYIVLGDGAHALHISDEAIQNLLGEYGELTIQIEQTAQDKYKLRFFDGKDEPLPRLSAPATVCLPAENAYATVFASYTGGSDNWGGQYDGVNRAISFETVFSGEYEIMENALQISDISELSEEAAEAIRFMASKGYFAVNENGEFLPQAALTRYDFTSALVGMVFALDRELKSDFPDVAADSPYYAYVASAQAGGIINGFDDGTFGGEKHITTEQVLALAARTLADRKGYEYPAAPEEYLGFSGGDSVSDWAKEAVALAAREGIVAPGETIDPTGDISRADAALYLYRMFMLLYEVSPVAIDSGIDVGKALSPLAASCLSAALLALAAALALYWKKRSSAEPKNEAASIATDKRQRAILLALCGVAVTALAVMTVELAGGFSAATPAPKPTHETASAPTDDTFENASGVDGNNSSNFSSHIEGNRSTEMLAFDGDFVFPDSSSRLLTEEELEKLGPHECIIART